MIKIHNISSCDSLSFFDNNTEQAVIENSYHIPALLSSIKLILTKIQLKMVNSQ